MKRFRHLRSLVLSMLLVVSLVGCPATGPVTSPPIEGPVGLGEIAAVDGPKVRPDHVIEDSRCPADVQCVVAGRLIVRTTVMGGGWSKQIDLMLGIPVPVADGMLTLVDATPVPISGHTPMSSTARFSFKFQGGR
ncbi:putative small lipoprotein YifL [Xanthomonas arboricola]|nr:putative small lipoprotein YifL [Xanthomonas arboricola]